ncbi:MAG: GNAT family N-acetyltransferase [Chloroflexota bacterium]
MSYTLNIITAPADIYAAHSLLVLCGEHMHRTQSLDHWYPYRGLDIFTAELEHAQATVYTIIDDSTQALIGTFYLSAVMRTWYASVQWQDASHKAVYLGGFGILPIMQGRGVGTWAMNQIDLLARDGGYDTLRFDGVASNPSLLRFYDKLNYIRRGLLDTPRGSQVMVYERVFGA